MQIKWSRECIGYEEMYNTGCIVTVVDEGDGGERSGKSLWSDLIDGQTTRFIPQDRWDQLKRRTEIDNRGPIFFILCRQTKFHRYDFKSFSNGLPTCSSWHHKRLFSWLHSPGSQFILSFAIYFTTNFCMQPSLFSTIWGAEDGIKTL